MSVFLDEIDVSLIIRRVVPAGAEIFRLARLDDVEGVKRLFSMGLASPNDSVDSGRSALCVSTILIPINRCHLDSRQLLSLMVFLGATLSYQFWKYMKL